MKQETQAELMAMEASTFRVDAPASLRDYNAFRASLRGLALSANADPQLKAKIVAKLVHKVEVKPDGFRLHCFVGARQIDDTEARKAKAPEASLLPGPSLSNRGSNTLDDGRVSRTLDEPLSSR